MTKEEEKLKKFLASDDPEMVRMGIAMAKGMDVQITIKDLKKILESYKPEISQAGAKLAIEIGLGDEALNLICKRDEMNGGVDQIIKMGSILAEFGEMAVEPMLNAVQRGNDEYWAIEGVVSILNDIGGQRALNALIEMLDEECERLFEWIYDYDFNNNDNRFYHEEIIAGIENIWIQSDESVEHLRSAFIDINENEIFNFINDIEDIMERWTIQSSFYRMICDMKYINGLEDEENFNIYFCPVVASEILTRKGWKPKTEKEKIAYCAIAIASGSNELAVITKGLVKTDEKEKILKFLESDDVEMVKKGVALLKATVKK